MSKRREFWNQRQESNATNRNDQRWVYIHELTALLVTRVAILGPIERMKIIMQTKHMAQYANPKADLPKGVADLVSKITLNQGIFSVYRGQSPLVVLLLGQSLFRFYCYESLSTYFDPFTTSATTRTLAASSVSALLLTTVMYPLDLCHTRMSCDMTKKDAVYNQQYQTQNQPSQAVSNRQNKANRARLYHNILDCIRKSQVKHG